MNRSIFEKSRFEKPFRFWCNDDHDSNEEDHSDSTLKDSRDNQIQSLRDLEDFTRLHLYVGGLQEAIANGTIQVGLEWKNASGGSPSIKVYKAAEPEGGDKYLSDYNSEYYASLQMGALYKTMLGTVDGAGGFKFPASFWQATDAGLPKLDADHPNRYILFEGVTEGKGQLVMTFWKGAEKIGEGGGVWIDLVNVRKMYQCVKATGIGSNFQEPHNVTTGLPPEPSMNWENDPAYPYDPNAKKSWQETKQCITLVHGWNTSYNSARSKFSDTMFKRLWHRGYKGRFAAFYWPTLYDNVFGVPYTYNASEYRAWKCGESLKQFMASLPSDYAKNLVCHSMGNIVGGSALRKGMSGVANYAMLNAAVPAICYDASGSVPQVQTSSPDLVVNDPATTALAYKGKLASVGIRLINFYLPNDSALQAWLTNNSTYKPQTYFLRVGSDPDTMLFGDHAYKYWPSNAAGNKLFLTFETSQPRYMHSLDESLSYAARSSTRCIGAESAASGSIQNNKIDMTSYTFGSTHSAEWEFRIQKTTQFYNRLLDEFDIPFLP